MTREELELALAKRQELCGTESQRPFKARSSTRPATFRVPNVREHREGNESSTASNSISNEQRREVRRQRVTATALAELELRLGTKPNTQKLKAALLAAPPTWAALLLGPTGCGKTSGARYLARHARATVMRASDLATGDRRHGLGEGLPPEVRSARDATVLILDDVGHERDTGALWDVLDYRYANNKPTIVTTGLTKKQLVAHISAATVRRIVEQHCDMPVLVVDCFEVSK